MSGQFHGQIRTGTIVDNTTNEHRFVRVRLPGIDDGLPDDELPWSGIGRPLFRGAGDKAGIWSRPRVGSKIAGIFDGGNRDSFVVLFELENPAGSMEWEEDEWGVQDEEGTHIKVKVGDTFEILHGDATILIQDGKVTVTGTELKFVGPTKFTDDVTMDKNLTVATEATIGGIAFTTHVHGGIQSGGGNTAPPQ